MGNQLSQASQRLDLAWTQGDPVSLAFIWPEENLSGTYDAPVKDKERNGTLLKNLTVVASYTAGVGTTFTLTMSQVDSADIPIGDYWWSLTQVNGVTRLHGRVNVGDGRQV